jgi:hypothetical protein
MKKILSIILTVTMVFSLVAAFRTPTASAFPTGNPVTLTTSNFITPYLTSKLSSYGAGPSDSSWILNNFSIMNLAPDLAWINGEKWQYNKGNSSTNMNYEVYKMGDTIYGKVDWGTGSGPTSWQKVVLCSWDNILHKYTVIDSSTSITTSGQTVVPFTMATSNVQYDGQYYLLVYKDESNVFYPGNDPLAVAGAYDYIESVYIAYQIAMVTKTLNLCPGHQTITGYIQRATGVPPDHQITVVLTYPTTGAVDNAPTMPGHQGYFKMAARYTINLGSSGYFTLDLNISASNVGKFYIFVEDDYNGYITSTEPTLGINSNDAIVYYYLSNIPTDLAITLSTYVNPTILYKDQNDQHVLLQLLDQNLAPVQDAVFTVTYEDGTTVVIPSSNYEVSPGYYRLEFDLAGVLTHTELRFKATHTIYGVSKTSNLVIIPLRDKGPFNPYFDVDFNVTPAEDNGQDYQYYGKYLNQDVYWRLPCTIGTLINIKVALWPVADSTNWKIYKTTPKISGPIKKIAGAGSLYADGVKIGYEGTYLITGPGKITASIVPLIWERVSDKWTFDEYNACCHTEFSKTFEICEVASCSVDKVALANGAQIDDTTIEVGKKSDLVLSINNGGDIECGCNSKIVWMYMVDGNGVPVADAFTMNTYGGGTKTLDEIWWNPMNAYGTGGGTIGAVDVATLYPPLPYQPILFGLTDTSLIIKDNCSTLTFSGLTFNYPNAEDCEYTLVVKVFGLKRAYDMCGNITLTYPMAAELINPVDIIASVSQLSTKATIIEAGLDPEKILAGVPVTIELTDPGFNPNYSYDISVWLNSIDAYAKNLVGFATVAETDTGIRINFSKAFGSEDGYGGPLTKIIIYGYQYNDPDGECKSKVEFTVEIPVVMPEFTIEIGLLDGTKIPSDGKLTEGFGEIVYVTPVDSRDPATHDFANDTWNLSASNTLNDCGLATDKVCPDIVPGVCCGKQAIEIVGYDNPCLDDLPLVDLTFSVNSADIYVTSFELRKPSVKVELADAYGNKLEKAPFTIPPTVTHVTFTVTDVHTHGVPGVGIGINRNYYSDYGYVGGNDVTASGYNWYAYGGITSKSGEVDWAFIPPYSGKYYISAGFDDTCLTKIVANSAPITYDLRDLGWGINTSATLEAVYVAPVVDTVKPVVEASAPAEVTSPMVTVSGKVTDNVGVVSLWVGADKVDFVPDGTGGGTFSHEVEVVEGANTIKVVAFDAAGLMGDKTLTVTYAVPKVTVVKIQIGSDIMTVNGKAVQIDAPAEIMNGRTFLPLRAISEALGATVDWIAETQGITVTLGENTIGLQVGNTSAVVNGTVMTLDAAPYIKNNRTMVPFRVIAEGLGATVEWDPALRIVTVTLAQ